MFYFLFRQRVTFAIIMLMDHSFKYYQVGKQLNSKEKKIYIVQFPVSGANSTYLCFLSLEWFFENSKHIFVYDRKETSLKWCYSCWEILFTK